jgi:glucan biosynthesis protein C
MPPAATPPPHLPAPTAPKRSGNLSGLAAVRAFGCICIVLAHAAIPYMLAPPPSIAWPVHDPGNRACDLLFLWCRASQCCFFILSGLMAAAALRHDLAGFTRSRLRLLGKPLLIAAFTILPLCYLVWMLGWWRTGYIHFEQLVQFRLSTDDKRNLLGLAHLWYLEYLLIYSLLYAAWRRVRATPLRPISARALLAFVLLAITWSAAWALVDPAMITDFRNSFIPRLTYLAYNGAYFAIGVMLWSARAAIPQRKAMWLTMIAVAQGVFIAWALLDAQNPLSPRSTLTAVAFSLLNSMGFTGLALVSRWDPGAAAAPIRTLVRSAYFTYLAHLPIVGAVNIALWGVAIPSAIKFLITVIVGLAAPILIHRAISRRGAIRALD